MLPILFGDPTVFSCRIAKRKIKKRSQRRTSGGGGGLNEERRRREGSGLEEEGKRVGLQDIAR